MSPVTKGGLIIQKSEQVMQKQKIPKENISSQKTHAFEEVSLAQVENKGREFTLETNEPHLGSTI